MKKVSIIVPVYNVEKYLKKTLDNICGQSLEELEVLCIDDGSTDHSYDILREYKNKDGRVQIFRQENKGPAVARNFAIEQAQGEYVAFVDADDILISENALESLYEAAVNNHAYVCGGFRQYYNQEGIFYSKNQMFREQTDESGKFYDYSDWQFDYDYQNYIFSLEFLKKHQLFFPNYRRYEDPVFLVKSFMLAKKFFIVPIEYYGYRLPINNRLFSEKIVYDLLCGIIDLLHISRNQKMELLHRKLLERIEQEYNYLFIHYLAQGSQNIYGKLLEAYALIDWELIKEEVRIITPLNWGLSVVSRYFEQYALSIERQVNESDGIVIYGAGTLGEKFYHYLIRKNLQEKVIGFLVTRRGGHEAFCGKPIMSIGDYLYGNHFDILIVNAVKHYPSIMASLDNAGITNYSVVDNAFITE